MRAADFLPEHWARSGLVAAQQDSLEAQLMALHRAARETLDQLSIQTATWGLDRWESAYGIPTDYEKPLDDRRRRVISKLRGQGTTTVALIRAVAESFANGEVSVTEYPQSYRFDIEFVGLIGIPPRMEDLTVALEDIKPAHLDYRYIINFCTWGEVGAKTWGALGGKTWGAVKEGQI